MAGAIRVALIVAFAVGILVATGDVIVPNSGASYLVRALAETGIPDEVRVGDLQRLEIAGDVREGDILRFGEPKTLLRLYALIYPARATFTDLRTGKTVGLADRAERPTGFRVLAFLRLLLMITALVLLVVRGRQPAVVALAAFIFLNEYTLAVSSGSWLGTYGAIAYDFLQGPLGVIASGALVYLASTFAVKTRAVKALLFAAYLATAIFALCEFASVFAAALDGTQWDPEAHLLDIVQIALTCAALVVFICAARSSESAARRRILILMAATAIGSAYTLIGLAGNAIFTDVQEDLSLAATIVMEIGLVYAIVVERLFDIGFVVNRAVVYAITSALVVLSFVAIEWLVGRTAETFGHLQGGRDRARARDRGRPVATPDPSPRR